MQGQCQAFVVLSISRYTHVHKARRPLHCLILDGNPSVVPPRLLQVSYVLAFTTGYAVTRNHTPAIPGSSVPFDTSLFSAGEVLLEVAI